MKKLILLAALTLAVLGPAMAAQELYRWTDPTTGKIVTTPTPPPYPIKNKRPGGTLPGVDMYNVELDENTPQIKAAITKRQATEEQERQKQQEKALRKAEQEARAAEEQRVRDEIQKKRQAESRTREPTDDEIKTCMGFIKTKYAFKDQERVRVEDRGLITVYKDGEMNLTFSLNAKNSWGAYAGAKTYNCKYFPDGSFAINDW